MYTTIGPMTVRNATVLPLGPELECHTWAANSTCAVEKEAALAYRRTVVKDYLVMQPYLKSQ